MNFVPTLLIVLATMLQNSGAAPTLVPFYSTEITVPAFLLQCRNATQQPRRVMEYVLDTAFRLDGQVSEPGSGDDISNLSPIPPGGTLEKGSLYSMFIRMLLHNAMEEQKRQEALEADDEDDE